jgi:hypothetical protein
MGGGLTEDLLPVLFCEPPAEDSVKTTGFPCRLIDDHGTHVQRLVVGFEENCHVRG